MSAPGEQGGAEAALGGSQELTLGVMGGGQLGRMFVHAAQRMGFFTAVLDPDPVSPAGRVSHHHIQTSYTDPVGLERLSLVAHAITTEFENVPAPRWPNWPRPVRWHRLPPAWPSPRTVRPRRRTLCAAVCPARPMP